MTVAMLDTTFQRILDVISDGVYVTTDDREIVYWSGGAERITGYRSDEVVGKHCYDNVLIHTDLHGKQLCIAGCPLQDSLKHGTEHMVAEVFLKHKDGERLAVYVKTSTFEEGGRTYGVEVFGELKTVAGDELTARVQELSDSAVIDPLSGLFNRRYFDAALEQCFTMYSTLGRRYGVLHFDIDNFKLVNDTFGHARGDEAIRFVAEVLSSNARKLDVAARYGGDEFAVICSVSTPDELENYGRRLVTLVHGSRFNEGTDSEAPLTVSAGGTLVLSSDEDSRSALQRADEAMYLAKRGGRDGLVIRVGGDG